MFSLNPFYMPSYVISLMLGGLYAGIAQIGGSFTHSDLKQPREHPKCGWI